MPGFTVDQGDGSVIVGENGGAVLINYPGATLSDIERLMEWLTERPWASAVFSSLDSAVELGALPAEAA